MKRKYGPWRAHSGGYRLPDTYHISGGRHAPGRHEGHVEHSQKILAMAEALSIGRSIADSASLVSLKTRLQLLSESANNNHPLHMKHVFLLLDSLLSKTR